MTALATGLTGTDHASPTSRLVVELGRQEARRMLRHPLLLLGVALSLAIGWDAHRTLVGGESWSGEVYDMVPLVLGPTCLGVALVVALAFHRERHPVAAESPAAPDVRAAGLLLGAVPLVLLVGAGTVGLATWMEVTGGVPLGEEPGHTEHAGFTPSQYLQHVALAVLAVATGAAAGRRLRHRATAGLVLLAAWFPAMFVYWAFQARAVMPFSLIQVQPVSVEVGPPSLDPTTLPEDWLLTAPGEYQDHWARLVVSDALAAWHDLWLLGVACLFLAMVLSGHRRRRLLVSGGVLAAVAVVAQFWVMP